MATPVLFLTLTPADIADPLLGAIGSVLPENFRKMDVFQCRLFVAKNPGSEAIFFDKIILASIRIILKYDASSMLQDKKGLLGDVVHGRQIYTLDVVELEALYLH
ncbi:hypothetical protein K438DRAFT_2166724 [Mycena galopus ATCC 62051]|nr:hypothetical protein K438DRAFT_2166724 [Mycena galopus ATCC 62051]